MRHWLLKTEPSSFSFDDLWKAPRRTTGWSGVRNYQARNLIRDEMKKGDRVLIYHSSAEPPAVVGEAEVVREGYPDPTQFDPRDDHFDAASPRERPRWFQVDVKAVRKLPRDVPISELRGAPELSKMALLQRGQRLSVQPVAPSEYAAIVKLAEQ
ncbi:MAG: EVE domain-containing protein [Myxococcales bacterium]|nr:EVE domain-containing protein [Myxococcales bacterium]